MALLAKKKIIVAKLESTYGTDASPTQVIQTSDLSIEPIAGQTVSRGLDRPTLGNDLQTLVEQYVSLSFKVEVAGSGAAGTAPLYGDLLLACALAETVVASTSVSYDPVSGNFDSATIYFHHDGQRHILKGARGSVALELNPGEIPHFVFTFMGLFTDPTSTADPAANFTGYVPALAVNNANSPSFSLHGVSSVMTALQLDLSNVVEYRNVVGGDSVEVYDRAPSGNVVIETPPISVKNWFTAAKNSVTGPLSFGHGTTAGNICTVSAPNTQVISPKYQGDKDSRLGMGLSLVPGSSGDDDLKILFT